jgi:hypothetical protein
MRLPATQNLTDGELYYIIRNGVRLTGMPAWGEPDLEQDSESRQLVLFIRHLSKMTPEEAKEMEKLNPKSPIDDLIIEPSGEIKIPGQEPEHSRHQ